MEIIADVYHHPPVNRAYPASPPGYSVAFHQGHARICDERTLVWCLAQPQLTINLRPRQLGFLGRWVEQLRARAQEPQATLCDSLGTLIPPSEYGADGWMAPEVRALFYAAEQAEVPAPTE